MQTVFELFGGIRPMADKLGSVPPSTVNSWWRSGRIPQWRHASILEAADRHGIKLTAEQLTSFPPRGADHLPASGNVCPVQACDARRAR